MEPGKHQLLAHYINKGDYANAEKLLKQELVKDPDDDELHGLLAGIYINTGKLKQAKQEIEAALAGNPENAYYFYILYRYFLAVDQGFRARGAIREALRLDPEESDYYGALASLEIHLHFYEDALANARSGLYYNPQHAFCLNMEVQALKKLGRKNEAHKTMQEALREHPDSSFTHENAGWLHLEAGEFEKAETHFLNSLRNDPDDAAAKRGYISALRGKTGWFSFLFKSTYELNYIYGRYFILLFILCAMIGKIVQASLEIGIGTSLIHVLSIVAFAIMFPVYIQPLFDFFLIRNGRGRLILESHQVKVANIAIIIFPFAFFLLVLSFFLPGLNAFVAFFILSVNGIVQGIFIGWNAKWKLARQIFFTLVFLYGCLMVYFVHTQQLHEQVLAYTLLAIGFPAINWGIGRLLM